jgi:hypothetical protein
MPRRVDAIALATAITCCAFQAAAGQGAAKVNAPALDQFADGKWVLRVDRAILVERLGVHRHSEEVDESEYRPMTKASTYPILVSDHGARVEIQGRKRTAVHPPMKGLRSSPTEPVVYKLDDGTFSGGRLVVWSGKNGLQGELTIYGSGVRIMSSERGTISAVLKPSMSPRGTR